MSLDNVLARVSDIEARIAGILGETPAPARATPLLPSGSATPVGGASATPVLPFNVALAQATGTATVKPASGTFAPEVEALIAKYSTMRGLDPAVVRAVIRAESDGNAMAVSRAGAKGLMQIMPDELKAYGIRDPFDPEQNISAGTQQLAEKLRLFNGDLPLALAAYNAGTGAVRKYHGVPPYPETQGYVRRIMRALGQE